MFPIYSIKLNSHSIKKWLFAFVFSLCFATNISAHPMPNSIVQIAIQHNKIVLQLKLPISEFELAFGKELNSNVEQLVKENYPQLSNYLDAHIKLIDEKNSSWKKNIVAITTDSTNSELNGTYNEILATVEFEAPATINGNEKLKLLYDVIIHQVVTHNALISITQDWENGITECNEKQIGVISLDTKNNVVQPFEISLQKGSLWKGFKSMVSLGVQHIAAGTDHLLFLLVLILPAALLVYKKQWAGFGGTKYSIIRLLKIVTAFTLGHSLTLALGALNILKLPSQPVEILIAFSILITAIHCIKPLFYGKEMYVAAGFGLIHGLAFATVLSNLHLATKQIVLSILGFNIGIELMQLFVIAIAIPIIIFLSKQSFYKYIRIVGAVLAGIAAIVWITERVLV